MKIRLIVDKEFKEPEIHVCCDRESSKAVSTREMLEVLFSEKITAYKNYETKPVTIHEIVRIYTENKKVFLRTKNDVYEIKERLYTLEEKLRDRGFLRISNTEIVNISQIEKLDMTYVGTIKMHMKNNDVTFVSRRYVSKMKEALR